MNQHRYLDDFAVGETFTSGDTLHSKVEVIEVKPSPKRPDRSILRLKYAAINQHGETVSSFIVNHLIKRSASAST
ncbi:MAG: hypothetical protein KZQ97_17590 [Candidatus Thiodiazotropha sp. (ex Dulcina madagascariensis)]|nr:hypothetical protein [Candidatus Thiodiazotropha sp. (ex Dulcina madagascariensis)]